METATLTSEQHATREAIVRETMLALSAIGPRPHGTVENENALDYVTGRLQSLGWKTVHEPFDAPCPQPRTGARLVVEGTPVPCVPFLESIDGRIEGHLEPAGECLVWGMHRWERWSVQSPRANGTVAISSFPTAVQEHIPSEIAGHPAVITSGADFPREPASRGGRALLQVLAPLTARRGYSLRAYRGSDLLAEGKSPHAIVVAHIDTVPGSPGVYDNAAGVAAAVSLADVIEDRPDVQLLITSGEEEGLAGARAFVEGSLRRSGAVGSTVACVLDGGGRGTVAEAWLDGTAHNLALVEAFRATAAHHGYEAVVTSPAPPASDHAAFAEAGIPAAMFTVNDTEILHTPEDVLEESKVTSAILLSYFASATLAVPYECFGIQQE